MLESMEVTIAVIMEGTVHKGLLLMEVMEITIEIWLLGGHSSVTTIR